MRELVRETDVAGESDGLVTAVEDRLGSLVDRDAGDLTDP
jgi:hypothetical protein